MLHALEKATGQSMKPLGKCNNATTTRGIGSRCQQDDCARVIVWNWYVHHSSRVTSIQISSLKHRNSKSKSKQGATWYILVDSTRDSTTRGTGQSKQTQHKKQQGARGDMVPENNAASWHQDMHPRRPRSPCPPIPFHPRHCPRKQKIRLYTPQKIGRIKRHPLLLLCVSQCAPGTKRYTKRFFVFLSRVVGLCLFRLAGLRKTKTHCT